MTNLSSIEILSTRLAHNDRELYSRNYCGTASIILAQGLGAILVRLAIIL